MANRTRHGVRVLLRKLNDEDKNSFVWTLVLKSIARKPISKTEIYLKYGFVVTEHEKHLCPKCKSVLNAGPDYQPNYCSQCGQRVSFNGIEWKADKEIGTVKEWQERNLQC